MAWEISYRTLWREKEIGRLPDEYEELMPLINKVEEQHDEIENYLEDIEEERNTTRTILDTISDGIILLNSRKEIVDYNERVKEIFHVEKDKRFRRISFLYHDEDFLRAVLYHVLELRAVIRLGRVGTVNVGADHGDAVFLGVVLAVAQLSLNGRFALAVGRIAGVDHSSHGCTSLACIRLAFIVSGQAQLVNNLRAD